MENNRSPPLLHIPKTSFKVYQNFTKTCYFSMLDYQEVVNKNTIDKTLLNLIVQPSTDRYQYYKSEILIK